MTTRRAVAICLSLLLLLVAHMYFAYYPRLRPAVPDPSSEVAALLEASDAALSFWIPYPHQNLPVLFEELGFANSEEADPEAAQRTFDALSEILDSPDHRLPSFGPLGLPPSHELAFATLPDRGGRVLSARVYPGMSLFARLAGRLAGNPWLGGGQVEVDQRTAWTQWQGHRWTVTEAGATDLRTGPLEDPWNASGLAFINWREASDFVPEDQYRLIRQPSGLLLESRNAAPEAPRSASEELRARQVALMIRESSTLGQRTLLFFAQDATNLQEIPRAASILSGGPNPDGVQSMPSTAELEHWSLPGESLLGLSGRDPLLVETSEAQITALDRQSLRQAEDLLSVLPGIESSKHVRIRVLWLDLANAHREAQRIAKMMHGLPLIPAHHARRWQSIADLCRPLADRFSDLTITISEGPDGLSLRLIRREPS